MTLKHLFGMIDRGPNDGEDCILLLQFGIQLPYFLEDEMRKPKMTQNEFIREKSSRICLTVIGCQREQFLSECGEIAIVLEELLNLVHLGQKRIQDHFVERPPNF